MTKKKEFAKKAPNRVREPWMSDQYIDLFERLDTTQALYKDLTEDADSLKDLTPEDRGVLVLLGAAFFSHAFTELNIARSLERIAFQLENRSE